MTTEARKEYMRWYRKTHRESIKLYRRKYYDAHHDEEIAYERNRNKTHKEQNQEYGKQYRESHREYHVKRNKEYRVKNHDRELRRLSDYHKSNLEKGREHARRRRASIMEAEGEGISAEQEKFILELHNHTCVYCGANNVKLEVDHIDPLSKGGRNDIDNATCACRPCNVRKKNKTLLRFLYDVQLMDNTP